MADQGEDQDYQHVRQQDEEHQDQGLHQQDDHDDQQPQDLQEEQEQQRLQPQEAQLPGVAAMNEQEARRYIQEEKVAQNARRMGGHSDGHNKQTAAIVLARMNEEPNKTSKMDELELAVQMGGKFSNTGPAMAYAVRVGLMERVGRGYYQLLPAGRDQ